MGNIPYQVLSGRQLISRLRELVDRVSDQEYRFRYPDAFALDYHVLLHLVETNKDVIYTKSVIHNLGKRRMQYIDELLGAA